MKIAIIKIASLLLFVLPALHAAAASNLDNLDPDARAQLEQKASHANPREQTFLYTELVHIYSQLAAQQLTQGETDKARASLKQIQVYVDRIKAGLSEKAKNLKHAEMLLEAASFRMTQLAHSVSSEDQPSVQATLKDMNLVHDQMLGALFAH